MATPRAFWDRDGYLYEVSPSDETKVRLLWSPRSEVYAAGWGDFGAIEIVEHLYGPLIGAA